MYKALDAFETACAQVVSLGRDALAAGAGLTVHRLTVALAADLDVLAAQSCPDQRSGYEVATDSPEGASEGGGGPAQ